MAYQSIRIYVLLQGTHSIAQSLQSISPAKLCQEIFTLLGEGVAGFFQILLGLVLIYAPLYVPICATIYTPTDVVSNMRPILRGIKASNFWAKFDGLLPGECWPYPGLKRKGKGRNYGQMLVTLAYKTTYQVYSHRVAFFTKNPTSEDGWVCHKCNNPPCCNPDHLYLGNPQTNADDRS